MKKLVIYALMFINLTCAMAFADQSTETASPPCFGEAGAAASEFAERYLGISVMDESSSAEYLGPNSGEENPHRMVYYKFNLVGLMGVEKNVKVGLKMDECVVRHLEALDLD